MIALTTTRFLSVACMLTPLVGFGSVRRATFVVVINIVGFIELRNMGEPIAISNVSRHGRVKPTVIIS